MHPVTRDVDPRTLGMTALRRLPEQGEPRRGKFEQMTPEKAFEQFGRETRLPFRLMTSLSDASDLEPGAVVYWHEGAAFRTEWLTVEVVQRHGVLPAIAHAVILLDAISPSEEDESEGTEV